MHIVTATTHRFGSNVRIRNPLINGHQNTTTNMRTGPTTSDADKQLIFKGMPLAAGRQVTLMIKHVKICVEILTRNGSKIIKCLRRRKYDPVTIERTKDLVFGPSTTLIRSFLEHCTPTNNAAGTISRDLSIFSRGDKALILAPLWSLVGTPSAIGPAYRLCVAYSSWCRFIFLILCFYNHRCLCVVFLWPLRWVGRWSSVSIRRIICKRPVTIRREICPIRAEISTHTHGEKLYISYLYD